MIRYFRTIEGSIHQIDEPQEGCWVAMTDPSASEVFAIANKYGIEVDHLRAPLDEEERSRIEVEDNYTLILVDIPVIEERNDKEWYGTIPLAIILTTERIFTVCLEDTPVLTAFMDGRVRNFYTYMKTRFILQILYKNATMFLHYLRIIDKKSEFVEKKLHAATRNQELLELLELEKSLVYFTTSLRSNEVVLEKMMKVDRIKKYPEDEELLEDVIIENKQAIEMTVIYRDIINGTRELLSSIIDSRLNNVMKYLTVITVIMAIPTVISGLYGMNVNSAGVPLADSPFGFLAICSVTLLICVIVIFLLRKKKVF